MPQKMAKEIEILESPSIEPQTEKTDEPAQEQSSGEEIPDDFDTEDINDREPEIDFDEPKDPQ